MQTTAQHKPPEYPTVSAYVVAHGAAGVIDFLRRTFDAEQLYRYDANDGSITHAEVRIDECVIMLAEARGACAPSPVWIHVYVDDVDATYRRALEAGGVSFQEPRQRHGDRDRRSGVKDPAGNIWWIATHCA